MTELFEPIDAAEYGSNPLAAHINRLRKEHRIAVRSHSGGGRAWRDAKIIAVREVRTAITYVIAFHEIGHILCDNHGSYRLEKESNAWRWVLEHADYGLVTQPGWRRASNALESYLVWAKRKNARKVKNAPKIPPRDHDFWGVRDRLAELGGLD